MMIALGPYTYLFCTVRRSVVNFGNEYSEKRVALQR